MKEISLNLDFSKTTLTEKSKKEIENKIQKISIPFFATYSPDIQNLERLKEKYKDKKNFIIEGNGGSISTFRAFYGCLGSKIQKNVFILDTDDPDYAEEIKSKCNKEETLLVIISKSGNSIQAISDYLFFQDYETLFITSETGPLSEIGKIRSIETVIHPEIPGRFSGITESALTVCSILGIDIEEIIKGAKGMYESCNPKIDLEENPALELALHLDNLENIGYDEVFLSMYSKKIASFWELIIQLFHESTCKNGKGQTFYGGEAPENQHHTLQRFNSGKKNSVGMFVSVKDFDNKENLIVGEDIKSIEIRDIKINNFNELSLENIIDTELKGTWQDTVEKQIPAIKIELDKISPFSIGAFTALMQYTAFYSAIIKEVDPCTQPGVEKSKEYMFELIKS